MVLKSTSVSSTPPLAMIAFSGPRRWLTSTLIPRIVLINRCLFVSGDLIGFGAGC